jgi:hypothetical protein
MELYFKGKMRKKLASAGSDADAGDLLFQVQSAIAKALHQPSLLTSPSTTLKYFGGSNNVHIPQL